jgi:hypothetical protein
LNADAIIGTSDVFFRGGGGLVGLQIAGAMWSEYDPSGGSCGLFGIGFP